MEITDLSAWAKHLKHPLVLVGFVVMLFVLVILQKMDVLPKSLLYILIAALIIITLIVVVLSFILAFKKRGKDNGGDGDFIPTENVPPNLIKYFLKTLEEKDVAIEERDAKIKELAEKYKELDERLAERSAEDALTAQAKERLEQGDLEGAEKLLRQSLEKNLLALAEKKKNAAADAFELGSLRELQLDYKGARNYYEQAAQLEPKNSLYLNNFGSILNNLGDHKKAIEYFTKALDIDLVVYGDKHPKVAIRYNNLGSAWGDLGEHKKAIEYYTKALDIDLVVYGDKHPKVAIRYNNLGGA
jgi:tetratricopeptide (TPR) repeat protein